MWQPIEAAPKDGTVILIYGGHPDGASDHTQWSWDDLKDEEIYTYSGPSKSAVAWWSASWWYCSYDSGCYGKWLDPTHWMPLPDPPVRQPTGRQKRQLLTH